MKKREAGEHAKVSAWVRSFLKDQKGCAVELKHTRGKDSLPFTALEVHQKEALNAVFTASVVHKLDDGVYRQLPFDIFGLANCLAFVAVRYPTFIAIISINVWCEEEATSTRRSLTSERARKIAYDIIACG